MALRQFLTQTDPYPNPGVAQKQPAPPSLSKSLNRVLSAAVVSPRFQHMLLADPATALAMGYNGESFQLTQAEYGAVIALRAGTLREFATQLLHAFPHAGAEVARHSMDEQPQTRLAEVTAQ